MATHSLVPPFTRETAVQKVRLAKTTGFPRSGKSGPRLYAGLSLEKSSGICEWTQRDRLILARKWTRDLDYRLIKESGSSLTTGKRARDAGSKTGVEQTIEAPVIASFSSAAGTPGNTREAMEHSAIAGQFVSTSMARKWNAQLRCANFLADFLREDLGLTATRLGCEPWCMRRVHAAIQRG